MIDIAEMEQEVQQQVAKKQIKRWQCHPEEFVEQAIGIHEGTRPGLHITDQQREVLISIGELVEAKILKFEDKKLTQKQIELNKMIGVTIMSGQGPGKDAFAAWVAIWFLCCFPWPRGLCSAPTAPQLQNVLFSEIVKWLNLKNKAGEYVNKMRDLIKVSQKKVTYQVSDPEQLGKRWFLEARTANPNDSTENQAETLAGVHEDFMLVLLDEASGIADPVFRPIEGGLTGAVNIVVVIFNPTKNHGYAYQTQYGPLKKLWLKHRWNCEESEIVSREHIERMKTLHGEKSNTYRIRVLGLPPLSTSDTIIPHEMAEEAQERYIEPDIYDPIVTSVDCAMGGDEAVVLTRHGMKVIDVAIYPNIHDTDELGHEALKKLYEHESDVIYVDVIGLGQGVYTYLKRYEPNKTVGVNVSNSAPHKDKYFRLRDELWWKTREKFEKKLISIPRDEILVSQLSDPRQDNDPQYNGKLKVESKRVMKKRKRGSPDRADALVQSFYRDDVYLRTAKRNKMKAGSKYGRKPTFEHAGTWMGN